MGHYDYIPDSVFHKQCCNWNCNSVNSIHSNEYFNCCVNNHLHVPRDDTASVDAQIACVETPHLMFIPVHDTNWHFVDIFNHHFYETLDNSDNYYVYVHSNNLHTSRGGFYMLKILRSGVMMLYDCVCHPMEPLCVLATLQLNLLFPSAGSATYSSKLEARRAYNNFMQDHITFRCYGI